MMMVAGFANDCISQNHLPQKGQFFVYWGYNRAWFADSDIHVYFEKPFKTDNSSS